MGSSAIVLALAMGAGAFQAPCAMPRSHIAKVGRLTNSAKGLFKMFNEEKEGGGEETPAAMDASSDGAMLASLKAIQSAAENTNSRLMEIEDNVNALTRKLPSRLIPVVTSDPVECETPEQAYELLKTGNMRFVEGELISPNRGFERLKETSTGQNPFAAVLSCADSRVPVEIVFDQGFGDIFVTRVAGNIVTTEIIGSLEFGTAVLGSKVIVVMGHSSCGAVSATMAGAPVPGVISSLYYAIRPGCDTAAADTSKNMEDMLARSIEENVKVQVRQLEVSPVLSGLVEEGKLKIVGGVYDLSTGQVKFIE